MDRRDVAITTTLFLGGLAILTRFMQPGFFQHDSIQFVRAAELTMRSGALHYAHPPGYPVFVIALAALSRVCHGLGWDVEFALVFFNVLTGAAVVAVYYLFLRKLLGRESIAVTSALFLLFNPLLLSNATQLMSDTFSLLMVVITLEAFLSLERATTHTHRRAALLGICIGLMVATRITNVLILPAILVYHSYPLIAGGKGGRQWYPSMEGLILMAVVLATSACVATLFYLPLFTSSGMSPLLGVARGVGWHGPVNPALLRINLDYLTRTFTVYGLLLAVAGFRILIARERRLAASILVWLFSHTAYFFNIYHINPRYHLPAVLCVVLLMGSAVDAIARRRRAVAGLLVVVICTVSFLRIHPLLEFRHAFLGPKEFAHHLRELTEPNATIIAMDAGIIFEYYSGRRALAHPIPTNDEVIDEFLGKVESLLANGTPVYVTDDGLTYDPEDRYSQALAGRFDPHLVGRFPYEDFHRNDLQIRPWFHRLWKLDIREGNLTSSSLG